MITEQQARTLFAHANPVLNTEPFDPIDVDAAMYLATLEQRSGKMTQLETRKPEKGNETRSIVWLAAVITVVVVGTGALFFNRGGDDPVASADIDTVQSLIATWNTQDGEAIASHFTADAVFDATVPDPFLEPWIGRDEIARRTAGYSFAHHWESAFDFTQMGEELAFNLQGLSTDFGSVERPQGVVVVISDGLIESFVIETDFFHLCIGETTSRCKVRETGEIKPAE